MIFHEFFHYIGLPPPKYRPKASFMKIDYFSGKNAGFNDFLQIFWKNQWKNDLNP